MRKKEEEEKEGERGKLYGPNLCCALAQIPMGLFVSLSNCLTNRMRIIGSALLGVSPIATYGVLGPLWHSLLGLQDVTVLYWSCSYNHPLGSYMGTLSDCFSCALCLPSHLPGSLHSSVAWKPSIYSYWGEEGLKTHEAQAATRVLTV